MCCRKLLQKKIRGFVRITVVILLLKSAPQKLKKITKYGAVLNFRFPYFNCTWIEQLLQHHLRHFLQKLNSKVGSLLEAL